MLLSHLRVVEIGSAAASTCCARLFADFGAGIAKVEPAGGVPTRKAAPLMPAGTCIGTGMPIEERLATEKKRAAG